jgi:hypothetical protein
VRDQNDVRRVYPLASSEWNTSGMAESPLRPVPRGDFIRRLPHRRNLVAPVLPTLKLSSGGDKPRPRGRLRADIVVRLRTAVYRRLKRHRGRSLHPARTPASEAAIEGQPIHNGSGAAGTQRPHSPVLKWDYEEQ